MSAIGGYLLLHYRQWQAAGGYLAGAVLAGLALWSLQHLAQALSPNTPSAGRWWWKSALWRYPVMLLVLWMVSRQSTAFLAGFVAGVTLLPVSVAMLAVSRRWQRPECLSIAYWSPKTARRSRQL